MRVRSTAALATATFLLGTIAALAEPSREAVVRRVDGLLARMTLDEKIGQLNLMSNGLPETASALEGALVSGRVGALMNFATPGDVAQAQSRARSSRLAIPLLFGLDVLRGFRTMFPVPIGEASSFDPDLARQNAEAIAREARTSGINWTFAPMADLARDPRWGRIVEGFGEDPTVGRLFTAARVAGFRAGGLATTLKHFAGYGAPLGGRDYDTTVIASTDLHDNYLPPFRAGIEAGAESVMSAFNALNGLPSTANPFLLTEVLRKRWGYGGFVVSDWAAIAELVNHGIARDGAEAARKALLAGVDMDMQSELFGRHLPDEVAAKRVPLAAIDAATRRVLTAKAQLGLFDAPDLQLGTPTPDPRPETREAARIAARDSMVLLRNGGALPIARGRKVALVGGIVDNRYDLIGPHAARVVYEDGPSLLEAVRARAAGSDVTISYAPGCDVYCTSDEGFAAAVETARAADLVVAVLGESTEITGEAASRATLDLPGRQRALLDALLDTGKPVVLVLVASRPIDIGPALARLGALMMAWFPGTEGGPALADLLFGDTSPSAKLPISWPRSVGQVPLNYDRLPTGRPHVPFNRFTLGYRDELLTPLFPFGFGLAYTSFAISDLTIASPRVAMTGTLEATVRVANTGGREGREVVQLYVRQPVGSVSRPLRQLKSFEKILLGPGESRTVTFRLPVSELGFHDPDGRYAVEPGRFELFAGSDAEASLMAEFEVEPAPRVAAPAAKAKRQSSRQQKTMSRRVGLTAPAPRRL